MRTRVTGALLAMLPCVCVLAASPIVRTKPVVIESCCCLATDGLLSPEYLFNSVVTNDPPSAFNKGCWVSRERGFVDLNQDGHEDVLLSAPESFRGTGGITFNVLLWTNGNYRCIGDVDGSASTIRVENEPGGNVRIWSYWHSSCRTGSFNNMTIYKSGFNYSGSIPVSFADEGESSIADSLQKAIQEHATVPIRWERSKTINDTNVWQHMRP